MTSVLKVLPSIALVLTLHTLAAAQNVTTGSLTGVVRDAQGGVLPGATVTAVHTPTGTSYDGVTQGDGRFTLLNVRVGGPYEIAIALAGFRTEKIGDVMVALGEASDVPTVLQLETVTETVTVTGEASQVFSSTRTGTTATIETAAIENLPTINRSLQDMARVNPFFVQSPTNDRPSALSVAGRSGRYNNLQIDGAVNNDVFGLADTATPGGQADTEPVSLDAVQELQLVVSPYDVRQAGFSGGGINAITRGGTNAFRGTAYLYTRDQDLVGKGVNNRPIATFSDRQGGGSVGGPVRRNRAFFFTNVEFGRRDTPSGFSVDGSSGQTFGREAEVQQVLDILRSRDGYDPGGIGEFIRRRDNSKVFVRGDINFRRHQATVRHNFVDGLNDIPSTTPNTNAFPFPDQFYTFNSLTNSTVGQVNSAFRRAVNELRVTYQRIRDFRSNRAAPFPHVIVRFTGNQRVQFGTDQFSAANELDQDIVELHDDLTLVRGAHQITIGTHNELFRFRNLFIRGFYGFYDFPSIDAFRNGVASSYSLSFANTADPRQSARFGVNQLGFYAGDHWRLAPRLSLTYGIRVDFPSFPDTPSTNPTVLRLYGVQTDVTPSTRIWSPRIGFNYSLDRGRKRQQLRGGIGLFGGRTPYVWLSNQYGNTGNEFTRVTASGGIPFSADPTAQPRNIGGAALNEINAIDPGYDYPQLVRGNLGYDRSVLWGLIASVELLYSKTVKDIDYRNLNLMQTSTLPDGRPRFARAQPVYSDVIVLTTTGQGSAWSVATKIDRRVRNGWFANGSFLWGRSRSVNDGGSSQARSNWVNQQNRGNPNAVPLGISNFDPSRRVSMAASYQFDLKRLRVRLSTYYNGQSGRPYGYVFSNDANNDGLGANNTNDLLYIPRDSTDVIVRRGTFDQLLRFLTDGDCIGLTAGAIMERNTCRGPWTNSLDVRTAIDVRIGRFDTEFTVDIQNLINLFSREKGVVQFALFNGLIPVQYGGIDPATGKMVYLLNNVVTVGPRYTIDDLRSRWQAQFGFRVRF